MPKFKVTVSVRSIEYYIVEADDEDSADAIVWGDESPEPDGDDVVGSETLEIEMIDEEQERKK